MERVTNSTAPIWACCPRSSVMKPPSPSPFVDHSVAPSPSTAFAAPKSSEKLELASSTVAPRESSSPTSTSGGVGAGTPPPSMVKVDSSDRWRVPSAVVPWTRNRYSRPGSTSGSTTSCCSIPVPFIARLLLKRPRDPSSPQTMAQIIGSVVVTRKIPRLGSDGSASNVRSPSWTSLKGRTACAVPGWSAPPPHAAPTKARPATSVSRAPRGPGRLLGCGCTWLRSWRRRHGTVGRNPLEGTRIPGCSGRPNLRPAADPLARYPGGV